MKLLYCRECRDVVKLYPQFRPCKCGASTGRYIDDHRVEIFGQGEVLGVDTRVLAQINHTPRQGKYFKGYVFGRYDAEIRRER